MALASILRRSAASAVPLATRFVGSFRRHHTFTAPLFSAALKHGGAASRQQLCRRFFLSVVHFSTEPAKVVTKDKKLLQSIMAEIDCANEEEEEAVDVPTGFPFAIEDNSGQQIVKLSREYEGETIEIEVYKPDVGTDEYNDDNDDSENSQQSSLSLVVKIAKDVGPSLEFSCSAAPDEVNIESLSVKDPDTSDDMAYEGPDFGDLDENLQKAFHKYLSVRGITPNVTNFMHEYMQNKNAREYKMWLKNLKTFIEE